MEQAEVVAKRSHDSQTQVGSLLVSNVNGAVIATGFNGFVRGANDNKLPTTRPDKHQFIVHSEMNMIANCARNGIAMNNCTVYCTLTPCSSCMKMLWQSGITRVIAKNKYKDFDSLLKMSDIKIIESEIEGLINLEYVSL